MTGNIVARRYARALFAIGNKGGEKELQAYAKDLASVVGVLESAPQMLKLFRNPVFSVAEKKAVLEKVLAKIDPGKVVRNFLMLLADKDRLAILPDIIGSFNTLLDEASGTVRGMLVTAVELAKARQGDIKKRLEKQTGRKLVLEYAVDPAILGGVVLKVGDRVLDASLRAQLQILKENIKRGE